MHNAEIRQEATVKRIISLEEQMKLKKAYDKIFSAKKIVQDKKAANAKKESLEEGATAYKNFPQAHEVVAEIKKILKEKEEAKPSIIGSIVEAATVDGKMTPEQA